MRNGFTIWLTGLSGAGKTTIALELTKTFHTNGFFVEHLDGDIIRREIASDLGFSKEDRQKNIKVVTFVSKLLSRNGVITVASFISPYKAMREDVRKSIGSFVEVFVRCPLDVCIQRDVKGLYKKAINGEIANFTGVSDSYDEPLNPEIIVDTDNFTVGQCVSKIILYLTDNGWISGEKINI